MGRMTYVNMWVDSRFKRKIKIESAKMDIPVTKLTRELAETDELDNLFKNVKRNFKI